MFILTAFFVIFTTKIEILMWVKTSKKDRRTHFKHIWSKIATPLVISIAFADRMPLDFYILVCVILIIPSIVAIILQFAYFRLDEASHIEYNEKEREFNIVTNSGEVWDLKKIVGVHIFKVRPEAKVRSPFGPYSYYIFEDKDENKLYVTSLSLNYDVIEKFFSEDKVYEEWVKIPWFKYEKSSSNE